MGGVRARKDEGEMDVCAFVHQYSIMHLSFAVCVCVHARAVRTHLQKKCFGDETKVVRDGQSGDIDRR